MKGWIDGASHDDIAKLRRQLARIFRLFHKRLNHSRHYRFHQYEKQRAPVLLYGSRAAERFTKEEGQFIKDHFFCGACNQYIKKTAIRGGSDGARLP